MLVRYLSVTLSAALLLAAGTVQAAEPSVEELLKKIQNPDLRVKMEALRGFKQLGSKARAAVPRLIKMLNPANPDTSTYEKGNETAAAARALYFIGTKEAHDALEQAFTTLSNRTAPVFRDPTIDIDNLPHQVERSLWLQNGIGQFLASEWPHLGINIPPEKMSVPQLRQHIQSLQQRIADCERELRGAEEGLRNARPDTAIWHYYAGMIRGLNQMIPELQDQLRRAKHLLDTKTK